MDEEMTITTPEDQPIDDDRQTEFADYSEPTEAAPEPEAAPAPDLTAKEKELAKKERALQKGFAEIARREKELQVPPMKAIDEGDDIPDLDPVAQKALKKYLDSQYGGYFQAQEMLTADLFESELENFAEKKGVDADDLRDFVSEKGLQPKDYSRKGFRELLNDSYTLMKPYDPEAERERITAEVREQVLKELADQGVVVEAVKPKRSDNSALPSNVDEMTPEERLSFYQRKGWI